jgi:hypothetical protein
MPTTDIESAIECGTEGGARATRWQARHGHPLGLAWETARRYAWPISGANEDFEC